MIAFDITHISDKNGIHRVTVVVRRPDSPVESRVFQFEDPGPIYIYNEAGLRMDRQGNYRYPRIEQDGEWVERTDVEWMEDHSKPVEEIFRPTIAAMLEGEQWER